MEAEERPTKRRKLSVSPVRSIANDTHSTELLSGEENTANGSADNITKDGKGLEREVRENAAAASPLSKNQQKKLRRQQNWEAGREDRKAKRKEKRKEKTARKREANKDGAPLVLSPCPDQEIYQGPSMSKKERKQRSVQVPVTFVFDCGFDGLMTDTERTSLASQLTRSYSDNRNALFRVHLAVASFGGKLKERFDGLLAKNYEAWNGFRFLEEDFVKVSNKAKDWMRANDGGQLAGALARSEKTAERSRQEGEGEVIYLTSDSDETLTELKPFATYIIGGIVDRNRHKGICYKRAKDRGIKTAKLPIGQYMDMASRFVLATNHVSEIMLRWLELGDWGEAFVKVIPQRKGGMLKAKGAATTENESHGSGKTQAEERAPE